MTTDTTELAKPAAEAPEAEGAEKGAAPAPHEEVSKVRISMRVKMLTAFTLVFTIIFVVVALFVINYVTNSAQKQIVNQEHNVAEGGAKTLDAKGLLQLRADLPEYYAPGTFSSTDVKTKKVTDFYYPTTNACVPLDATTTCAQLPASATHSSPLYDELNQQLLNIRKTVANASPYTYFFDPASKQLVWESSWAAVNPSPPFTVEYRGPVAPIVGGQDSETYQYMAKGLNGTIDLPVYQDANGFWISTFTPIKLQQATVINGTSYPVGTVVGGLGVDYPLDYVSTVRSGAIRGIIPILAISYLILIAMVFILATWLTRPLKRLTAATQLISSGDYDVDMTSMTSTRLPDEMTVLSHSFKLMVDKVRAREQSLTQQVRRLSVQIDSGKRAQSVAALTDSDFFAGIVAKGAELRAKKNSDEQGGGATDAPAEAPEAPPVEE